MSEQRERIALLPNRQPALRVMPMLTSMATYFVGVSAQADKQEGSTQKSHYRLQKTMSNSTLVSA